jgi:transcription termination factor Rho
VTINPRSRSPVKKSKSKSNKQTQNPSFKTKKGNFRDSDFEFDGIIESEGVLEMMADGYGFLRLLIIIILHHQMIFINVPD